MAKGSGYTRRGLTALSGLLAALTLPGAALGETATQDLTVTAGLARALSVECGSMSLGVVRLPSGPRGGVVQVFREDGDPVIGGPSSGNASLVEDPGVGECTVTATPNACLRVNEVNGGTDNMSLFRLADHLPLEPRAAHGLPAAARGTQFDDLRIGLEVDQVEIRARNGDDASTVISGFTTDDNGVYILVVQGDLKIPDNLSRDDFGGYGTTVTLTFDTDGNCDP